MTERIFGVVRPYDSWMRELVFGFLGELGYRPGAQPGGQAGEQLVVASGTPDREAAAWIGSNAMDLLLLPYNKHRNRDGIFVDGIGVAQHLPHDFAEQAIPILMPVTTFSYRASFHQRLEALEQKRPDLTEVMVVMPEAEIGTPDIRRRIEAIAKPA